MTEILYGDSCAVVYRTEATDCDGDIVARDFVFTDLDYPHSSHLVDIMRSMDDYGFTMTKIEVHSITYVRAS